MKKIIRLILLSLLYGVSTHVMASGAQQPSNNAIVKNKAVVLLLPQAQVAKSSGVKQTLQQGLNAQGWTSIVLLVTKPEPEQQADYHHQVNQLLRQQIQQLKAHGYQSIVLIGQGNTNPYVTHFLAHHHDKYVDAFVGIDMDGHLKPANKASADNVASLLQMQVPVLDIYGSKSNRAVLSSVDRRAFAIATYCFSHKYQLSKQIRIMHADPSYRGYEMALLKHITTWLNTI